MKHYSGRLVSLLAGAVLLCATAMGQNGGLRFSLRDLGTFGGFASRANAINNEGQVVGVAYFSNGDSKCFVWRAGLTPLLFTLNSQTTKCEATAISPDGMVAGSMVVTDDSAEIRLEHLERHGPIERQVACAVHLSHATLADQSLNYVAGNLAANADCHLRPHAAEPSLV